MRLISIASAFALLGAAGSLVSAANPGPTFGHSAILIDNTVFIQGGITPGNTPSKAAFSLLLDSNKSLTNANLLDITDLSSFTARDFHGSVDTLGGLMVNCGTLDGVGTVLTCDAFNVARYNSSVLTGIPDTVQGRGGMAVTVSDQRAYFLGGSNSNFTDASKGFSTAMDILMVTTSLNWRKGTDMPTATRFHTATWVDGTNVGGLVVLGGQILGGAAVSMNNAALFIKSVWSTRAIVGDAIPARYGHSAVLNAKGTIFVYGGRTNATGPALNDLFMLDTTAATWAWKKLVVPTAEPRAFHASVLLPDGNTILHTFGMSGAGPETAVNTFSSYQIDKNAWIAAAAPPPATVATTSPNKLPDTNNRPGDPNFKHPGVENGDDKKKAPIGMIVGIAVGGIVVLVAAGLLFQRQRKRRAAGGAKRTKSAAAGLAGEDGKGNTGSKLGRSFTIRKPDEAYLVVGDNDPNEPYYGDLDNQKSLPLNYHQEQVHQQKQQQKQSQSYQEYELNDTRRFQNSPDIAETQRMVEEEQRKMMKSYQQMSAEFSGSQNPILNESRSSPRTRQSSPYQQQQQGGYGGHKDEYNDHRF
ncbi:hypothetical protein BGZ83_007168 [Gryganskiella cystojenkinii]|nr:hypothetical protein BGZ83_007168 [Gryganskiella cystojenkinii]